MPHDLLRRICELLSISAFEVNITVNSANGLKLQIVHFFNFEETIDSFDIVKCSGYDLEQTSTSTKTTMIDLVLPRAQSDSY